MEIKYEISNPIINDNLKEKNTYKNQSRTTERPAAARRQDQHKVRHVLSLLALLFALRPIQMAGQKLIFEDIGKKSYLIDETYIFFSNRKTKIYITSLTKTNCHKKNCVRENRDVFKNSLFTMYSISSKSMRK